MGKKDRDDQYDDMVKNSFKKGDADKDWESARPLREAKEALEESDPADDLPPVD